METKRIPLNSEQARLLIEADSAVRSARSALEAAVAHANTLAAFAMAGAGVQGRPVQIDTDADPPTLVVEVGE